MSAAAYRRGVSEREREEIQVCLNCPLPECVGKRHMDCPIFDPKIVINEMILKWNAEVSSALRRLRKKWRGVQ